MRALEEASGKSLERFFDQWVYRPGHPDLRVKIGWDDGLLTVELKQKQKTGDVATFAGTFGAATTGGSDDNSFAVYLAVQCSDTQWPLTTVHP